MEIQRRTTSAGYRIPTTKTTSVHRLVTRPQATQTSTTDKRSLKQAEKCDEVSYNKIWREQVHSEWKGVKDWERNWGFTKECDPRGRPKTPKLLPDRESVFSENISPTQGHVYGQQLNTEIGKKMINMEFFFHSSNRRCRMGNEFVCF